MTTKTIRTITMTRTTLPIVLKIFINTNLFSKYYNYTIRKGIYLSLYDYNINSIKCQYIMYYLSLWLLFYAILPQKAYIL